MADMFPVALSIYSPEYYLKFEKPYTSIGIADPTATQYSNCRVIVHNNRIIVGADTARGAQEVFKDDISEMHIQKPYTYIITAHGFLVVFAKSKDCGCGSRLKAWNPYGQIVKARNRDS